MFIILLNLTLLVIIPQQYLHQGAGFVFFWMAGGSGAVMPTCGWINRSLISLAAIYPLR